MIYAFYSRFYYRSGLIKAYSLSNVRVAHCSYSGETPNGDTVAKKTQNKAIMTIK